METLESSRVCRLCGKQSGISINIFDKNENHVKKINAVLPIMVHEMDLLPKHMCHRCSYKLEEFHKFYVDCLRTDADLKSQLSWMRKEDSKERVGVPMVHIENINIKVEPPDYDAYQMNPVVPDVGYANPLAYPVNGLRSKDMGKDLTYAAYARYGCYCDKPDQSNNNNNNRRCLAANFDRGGLAGCRSRINDAGSENEDGEASKSQTAGRTNLLAGRKLGESPGETKDASKSCARPCSSGSTSSKRNGIEAVHDTGIVRNLRPRKGSVDYVGVKRRATASGTTTTKNVGQRSKEPADKIEGSSAVRFDVTRIKLEKIDDIVGRILRPRKGTIDYIGPKRKYSRAGVGRGQRSRTGSTKVRNVASRSSRSTLTADRMKLTIKEEQISDFEDSMLDDAISTKDHPIGDPADPLANDRINCNVYGRGQHASDFHSAGNWKHARSASTGKPKPSKIGLGRMAAINYSPKYLRSQDVCLRSGKIRKPDSADVSTRKLRRRLRNFSERSKAAGRNLMKTITGSISTRDVSATMKLIDNIKHYCDECNTSFVNKELFKLHACYGH